MTSSMAVAGSARLEVVVWGGWRGWCAPCAWLPRQQGHGSLTNLALIRLCGDWHSGIRAASTRAAPGARAGCIVNLGSGAALRASLAGILAYCAAKHAVLSPTRQLAHELGPFGIRVNSVTPGSGRTNDTTERQWASRGSEGQRVQWIP